ncbi:ybak/aminoacyl-tRNA synthetase-associated domain-containing protein [Anaeramoeba ignava]|uniref:Ybak/aminoacyl-tRNA synthetase-associated domain-containing protein n=1 Tax=Anaeramoeba ignava TaxID=1746090 RepID=A0A9Q0R4S0_ANAIG|nr:ybak/aminoacyl-tRNA synthetase-associated domain-containing protein [Anaeramoeba ignava]
MDSRIEFAEQRIKEIEEKLKIKHEIEVTKEDEKILEKIPEKVLKAIKEKKMKAKPKYVPSDYYEKTLEKRSKILNAPSINHLCKSIILENIHYEKNLEENNLLNQKKEDELLNAKYFLVLVQYSKRLNFAKIANFFRSLLKDEKRKFEFKLAPENISFDLSGFEHNAITPIGMNVDLPIIISDSICALSPQFFWMGGGQVDLKLCCSTLEFMNIFHPLIASITD